MKEQEKLPADVMTLEEYQHKAATEGKDAPKDHPVLGSHSQSLGFKTEDEKEKEIKKAEVLRFFYLFNENVGEPPSSRKN